jgi:hypothetical protein
MATHVGGSPATVTHVVMRILGPDLPIGMITLDLVET